MRWVPPFVLEAAPSAPSPHSPTVASTVSTARSAMARGRASTAGSSDGSSRACSTVLVPLSRTACAAVSAYITSWSRSRAAGNPVVPPLAEINFGPLTFSDWSGRVGVPSLLVLYVSHEAVRHASVGSGCRVNGQRLSGERNSGCRVNRLLSEHSLYRHVDC